MNATLGTALKSEKEFLVLFDLERMSATEIGPIGHSCVWGIVAYGPKLFRFGCEGRILSVDTTTGAGTELHQKSPLFRGAATPPRN